MQKKLFLGILPLFKNTTKEVKNQERSLFLTMAPEESEQEPKPSDLLIFSLFLDDSSKV